MFGVTNVKVHTRQIHLVCGQIYENVLFLQYFNVQMFKRVFLQKQKREWP